MFCLFFFNFIWAEKTSLRLSLGLGIALADPIQLKSTVSRIHQKVGPISLDRTHDTPCVHSVQCLSPRY